MRESLYCRVIEPALWWTLAAIIIPPLIVWGIGQELGWLPTAEQLLGPRFPKRCSNGRCNSGCRVS